LFDEPDIADGQSLDTFGVQWLWDRGVAAPFLHPLENAGLSDVERHPRPSLHEPVQLIQPDIAQRSLVIADAPCPGLLELCFMLRNPWRFLDDITSDWKMASALMEWSLDTIVESYAHMVGQLPSQPDVIVYSDDLGFHDSMFLSPNDFRTHVLPRLRTLLARIRRLTPAAICFHSCGAILPIMRDIADLGVDIVNVDTKARGMAVREIRQSLSASTILHGATDLCALGAAIANRDTARVALLITELADSAPVIAGPIDSLSSGRQIADAARGASFVRCLSDEDFLRLGHIGPVRSVIEEALERTQSAPSLALCLPNSHGSGEHLPRSVDPFKGEGGENKGHTFVQ
jgi:hypothetical protein